MHCNSYTHTGQEYPEAGTTLGVYVHREGGPDQRRMRQRLRR